MLFEISGMVWIYTKVGKKQLLATWMVASAVWFDRHEHGVNVFERLGIAGFQNPPFFADAVFVKDPETPSLLFVRPFSSPGLERARVLKTRLRVQIESIENQRLSLCVEHATVRLVRPLPGNIMNVCHIQITSTHQLTNVAIMLKQLLALCNFRISLIERLLAHSHKLS